MSGTGVQAVGGWVLNSDAAKVLIGSTAVANQSQPRKS